MELKRTRVAFESKAVDVDAGTFEGHASIFGIADDGEPPDIIQPGAFTKTLKEWGPQGANRIKVLALHRSDWLPIGRPLDLREDVRGLWIRGKLSDTTLGKDVLTLLRDGVLTEMSIGFTTVKAEPDRARGVRLVREVRLYEISLVTWAMHPQAQVTDVKTALTSADPASSENPASPPAPAAALTIDPGLLQSIKTNTEVLRTLLRRTA